MATEKTGPKVQQFMNGRYKGMPVARWMDLAVKAVLDGRYNVSESARQHGVTRARLSQQVGEKRRALADMDSRSKAAAAARQVETAPAIVPDAVIEGTVVPKLEVTGEARRIPPFPEFVRKYFGTLECPDCGRHHELPDFHVEMMEALAGPDKRLLVNMPPYHSKSTVATVQHTVYELCRDPNTRVLVVSKSQKLAERFLYQITKYLSDPNVYPDDANLLMDWGPFNTGGEQWNKQQLYIAGRQSAEKDPSVSALGVGGHIYGIRADTIKFDDIADLENQRNAERVKEMLTWCTQEAASRVGRNGKLQFIGTRISAGDIYSYLQDLPSFRTVRYPCILDEEQKLTLWPDHFPFESAALQRESMAIEQWQLVYQNVDTPGFGASFPPEVVEATYDAARPLGHYDPRWALVAGLDPAGANSQSGYTALVLVGVDLQSGMRYLVDLVAVKQMKAPQLRDQIFDWADKYPLRELRVESNGLQALALDTAIPTPAGWTTMGELAIGDVVFAPDGSPTPVVAKSDVHQHGNAYTVTFSDGTSLVADAGHRWHVQWPSDAKTASGWTTTAELAALMITHPGAAHRSVPNTRPLELPDADLPIDPYLLGTWLGDGSSASPYLASNPDNGDQQAQRSMLLNLGYEIKTGYVDRFKTAVPALRRQLADLGVLCNKHIPEVYLRASVAQRLALLQGLLDTDGSIAKEGRADFANKNQSLIAGCYELLVSLGWRPTINHRPEISRVFFHPKKGDLTPFRLQRKVDRIPAHNHNSRTTTMRAIVGIDPIGECPVACIKVAHESSQFLAGRQMVPTGNSQLVQYNQEILGHLTARGTRVVPHITTGHNKWDPQFGVESMASMFINRQISLPTQDVASRNRIRPLVEQLQAFPMGAVSDLVMAFWFAELGIRETFQRAALPMFDPRMRLPNRVASKRRVFDFAERTVKGAPAEEPAWGRTMFPGREPASEHKLVNMAGSIFVP
jgi:hypothetical protein